MSLKLNVIIGSTRPGRAGPAVAEWVAKAAKEHGKFDVDLVDLAEFNLPLLDEPNHPMMQNYQHAHTKRWSATIDAADAFVFVTPEYDYYPSAALINAVQVLAKEWHYKPAGVVSYGGISGGLRASQQLRGLLSNVNIHALPQAVPVPMFSQFVDDSGTFQPNDAIANGTTLMLNELDKWAVALKPMRG